MDALAAATAVLVSYVASGAMLAPLGWLRRGVAAVASLLLVLLLSIAALLRAGPTLLVYPWAPSFGIYLSLHVDWLSGLLGVLVAALSLCIAVYSIWYIGSWGSRRYWFFYTFFVASMLLLLYANDFLSFIIGWEGTGIASFMLIGFYLDDRREAWVGDVGRTAAGVPMWSTPSMSSLRAILFTRLGDACFLAAVGAISFATGSTLFSSVHVAAAKLGSLAPLIYGLFFIAPLAKSAQMPFTEWLVTAMTGPAPVSALIHAATMVKAGVYFVARFVPMIPATLWFTGLMRGLACIALVTMVSTALMALVAREFKLILAYSTASQLSYMMAAVFYAAGTGLIHEGVVACFTHLMSHAVFKAALFLEAGAVIHAVHTRYIDEMGGLRRYMPLTYIATLLAGLSLAGVPPFSGWWSKDYVIDVLGSVDPVAGLVALLAGLATAAYTARMIYYVFHGEPRRRGHEAPPGMLYPYLALGVAALVLGLLWPLYIHGLASGLGGEYEYSSGLVVGGVAASTATLLVMLGYERGVLPGVFARLRVLREFLYDRCYVNAAIYWLVVKPVQYASRLLSMVDGAVDRTLHSWLPCSALRAAEGLRTADSAADKKLHHDVPAAFISASRRIRRVHSGDLEKYILYFIVGVAVVAAATSWVVLKLP